MLISVFLTSRLLLTLSSHLDLVNRSGILPSALQCFSIDPLVLQCPQTFFFKISPIVVSSISVNPFANVFDDIFVNTACFKFLNWLQLPEKFSVLLSGRL